MKMRRANGSGMIADRSGFHRECRWAGVKRKGQAAQETLLRCSATRLQRNGTRAEGQE